MTWISSAILHLSVVTKGELRKGLDLEPQGKRRTELHDCLEAELIPMFESESCP